MQTLHSRNIPFPPPPVKNGNQPLNLYFPIAIFAEKRYSIQRTLQDLQYIPETIKIQGKCTIHIFFIQLFPLLRRTGLHRNCLGPFRIVPAQPRRHATDARTVFFPFGKGDEVKAPCNECRLAGAPVFTGPSANADARQKKRRTVGAYGCSAAVLRAMTGQVGAMLQPPLCFALRRAKSVKAKRIL